VAKKSPSRTRPGWASMPPDVHPGAGERGEMSDNPSAIAAAAVLATIDTDTVVFPLPSSRDLSSLSSKTEAVELFVRLRLLRPLVGRVCPKCSKKKPPRNSIIVRTPYLKEGKSKGLDGVCLRCSKCKGRFGIRQTSWRSTSAISNSCRRRDRMSLCGSLG
jgi:hypothetical protein